MYPTGNRAIKEGENKDGKAERRFAHLKIAKGGRCGVEYAWIFVLVL